LFFWLSAGLCKTLNFLLQRATSANSSHGTNNSILENDNLFFELHYKVMLHEDWLARCLSLSESLLHAPAGEVGETYQTNTQQGKAGWLGHNSRRLHSDD
jgi:hypothetical protein